MLRPVDINADSLALDLIDFVGPGGTFLTQEHTMANFRRSWYSALFDRGTYDNWKASGSLKLSDRLNQKVLKILKDHQAKPLPTEIIEKLDAIEKSWQ